MPVVTTLREQLELPGSTKGAVVAQVQPGSPAAQAGVREGDLVVGVGTKPVATPGDAAAAIRGSTKDGKTVALRIVRNGQPRFIAVPLSNQSQSTQGQSTQG